MVEGGRETGVHQGLLRTELSLHACCAVVTADLLGIVVPGALGRVAEDVVQHVGSVEDIQLAAPPVAVVRQTVLRHLHHQVPVVSKLREREEG